MLKLKNIKITSEYIEAEYTPENSDKTGYIKIYLKSGDTVSLPADGYENTYPSMARMGLRSILDYMQSHEDYTPPTEKLIMWY